MRRAWHLCGAKVKARHIAAVGMARGGGPAQPSTFARPIRVAYLVVAWVFVAAVLIQVFFAGLMIFVSEEAYTPIHRDFGYWIGIFPLALLVLALLGRLPRRAILSTAVLFALYFLQTALPVIPALFIAAFHTVVALLVFGLATVVAVRARTFVPRPLGTAPTKAAASP